MQCNAALKVGFYKGKCQATSTTDVEGIVFDVVKLHFSKDPTITAALLRLHFHDCFVTGCDASILLDGNHSEKKDPSNLTVRGYEIVDAVKAALEEACPHLVSCADIIAMSTRDAISLSGGGRYEVETGRRDGMVSATSVVLPDPSRSVSHNMQLLRKRGLNSTDMVYLLGAHTIGHTHCSFIQDRLYNFTGTRKPDPDMEPKLLQALRRRCPHHQDSGVDKTVKLDQNPLSANIVDNSYYKQIISHRGILQIDQELALDPLTKSLVSDLANDSDFFSTKFGEALVKLGTLGVLTGTQGEVRRSCGEVNKS